jgi:hypothetical protein
MADPAPLFIPFPETKAEEAQPSFISIPDPAKPTDPGLAGYQAAVEKYRPEASKQAAEASAFETYMPRATQIPLVGPMYSRAISAASAALGQGEGETFSERERNIYAGRQAYEEELRRKAGYGSLPARVAEGAFGLVATPMGGIARPTQALIEKGVEKVAPYLPAGVSKILGKSAPMTGQVVESGTVGGISSLAETKPGETAEEMASRAALGTAIGAGAPVVAKGAMYAARPFSTLWESIKDPKTAVLRDLAARAEKEGAKPANVELFSPQEFALRVGSSAPPKLTDVAGSKGLLEAATAKFGAEDPRVKAINKQLRERLENQSGFISDTIDRGFSARAGQPVVLDAAARREAADKLARTTNAPLYRAAFSHPNAASIYDPKIMNFLNTNEGRLAYDWASNQANMRSGFYGSSKGAPPVQNPFVVSTNNQIELAPGLSGANLEFLDLVKRGAQLQRNPLQKKGDTTGLEALDTSINEFTKFLTTKVDVYGKALANSGKFLRGNNAFDAGAELYPLMTNTRTVGELNSQIKKYLKDFTPEERALYREGFGSYLKENPEKAAVIFKGGTPETAQLKKITRNFLGDVAFKEIDAGMRVARVSSLIDAINAQPSLLDKIIPNSVSGAIGAGGGTLGVASFFRDQLPQAASHPITSMIALATAAGVGANKVAATRKLEALLEMASSTDRGVAAKAAETLQQIAAGNTEFGKLLGRIENRLSTYLAQTHMLEPNVPVVGPLDFEERRKGVFPPGNADEERMRPVTIRPNRASGGKVNSTSIADRLVIAAESAKKMSNKATEPLLRTSDESIARALEIANRHI